jgi:hypothetical protein
MASLELTQLSEYLETAEIKAVRRALKDAGLPALEEDDHAESVLVERDIDDDIFVDFVDRLEANEAAADIYLPGDFEVVLEVGDHKIGSAHALLLVLESLREDFFVEDEEDEVEEEEESDDEFESFDEDEEETGGLGDDEPTTEMKDERLRHIWKAMQRGAKLAIQRRLSMFVRD